jgi:hypothetical protein
LIVNILQDPSEFEEKLREAQAKEATTAQPKQKELEHVIALLADTEKEVDEIASATIKARGIVAARLEQQAEEVDRRYQALTARKSELQDALSLELTDNMIDDLMRFREIVATGLLNPTLDDKRRWLEILQTTVTVWGGLATITCR